MMEASGTRGNSRMNKHIGYYSLFVVFKALNRSAFSEFNFEKYELLIYGFGLDSGEGRFA
jgi:hypothetical protein